MSLRPALVVAVLAVFSLTIPVALADTAVDVRENDIGDRIDYTGQKTDGHPSRGANGSSRGGTASPVFRTSVPQLSTDAAGRPCIATDVRTFADPASAAATDAAQEQRWLTLVGAGYALCPGAVAPGTSAAALALAFWGEVPLPVPAPRIAPGSAITGLPAYLETGGVVAKDFARDTPLGAITIGAHGRFFVDWGDGTHDGPFDLVGAAWPDGTITHTYTKTGAYDVVVTERWTASWQLAGRGGPLGGLQTVGRIQQFPVTEVQAVRNR